MGADAAFRLRCGLVHAELVALENSGLVSAQALLLAGDLVSAQCLLLEDGGLVHAELVHLRDCGLVRAQTLLLLHRCLVRPQGGLLHDGLPLGALLDVRHRSSALGGLLLVSHRSGLSRGYLLLLGVIVPIRRLSLLALCGDLVRAAGFLRSELRRPLVLLGDGTRLRHRLRGVRAEKSGQRQEREAATQDRHTRNVFNGSARASDIFAGTRWDQAKNGLCTFCSPTVVSGPWPGQMTVSSLNVRISARFVASASP